MEIIRKYIR